MPDLGLISRIPPVGLIIEPLPVSVLSDIVVGLAGYMTMTDILNSTPELVQAIAGKVAVMRRRQAGQK